jgi:Lon protease-like protein
MRSPIQTRYEDLPSELPIFPLNGALLLPWGRLPLNIFEPRYLNMTLDALGAGRIIGMVQPDYDEAATDEDDTDQQKTDSSVYNVGCAGRIASFDETEDGRLHITLKGLIRFRVVEELGGPRGYRCVRPSYSDFKSDLEAPVKFNLDRDILLSRLKRYIEARAMPINLEVIKGLSDATLVMSLCMICPFDPREKQALLESATMTERTEALLTLLQMGVFDSGGAPDGLRQ